MEQSAPVKPSMQWHLLTSHTPLPPEQSPGQRLVVWFAAAIGDVVVGTNCSNNAGAATSFSSPEMRIDCRCRSTRGVNCFDIKALASPKKSFDNASESFGVRLRELRKASAISPTPHQA